MDGVIPSRLPWAIDPAEFRELFQELVEMRLTTDDPDAWCIVIPSTTRRFLTFTSKLLCARNSTSLIGLATSATMKRQLQSV